MKVSTTKLTIEIDIEEWRKIFKEWQDLKFADKPIKVDITKQHNLYQFLEYISMVAQNPSHIVDKKI